MLALATTSAPTLADSPQLRPVPKSGTQLSSPAAPHQAQRDGWNLQWRKSPTAQPTGTTSSEAAFAPVPASTAPVSPASASRLAPQHADASLAATQVDSRTQSHGDVFDEPPASLVQLAEPIASIAPAATPWNSPLRPVSGTIPLHEAPVSRAAWAQPQIGMPGNAPMPVDAPNARQIPIPVPAAEPIPAPRPLAQGQSADDFFSNPFGDEPQSARRPVTRVQELPAPGSGSGFNLPTPDGTRNELRGGAAPSLNPPAATEEPLPAPAPAAPRPNATDNGPSLGEMLQEATPRRKDPDIDSPSDRENLFENPFDREDSPGNVRPRSLDLDDDEEPRSARSRRMADDELTRPEGISCEDFRRRIASQTIRDVSLDISPPFRPDIIEEDEFQKLKNRFDEKQELRQWRSIAGEPLASGRLVDLAYEKAVVETEYGSLEELPINRLSEADLAYISNNWGLPTECLIEQVAYQPRAWTRTTMTWKASNLCHKPLYFEDVNLERYGHTAGPFLQPVVSSAHFFVNIAVLPYKMGIHPPGECQYALGYYRPGNCAPWITPPVPISLRGGLTQAAVMTGAFWLIP